LASKSSLFRSTYLQLKSLLASVIVKSSTAGYSTKGPEY